MDHEIELPEIPDGVDVPMIEMIHAGKDSYIPFMRRGAGGKMENLCSIPAGTLRNYFPSLLKWLTADAYMGINSYYRPAPYESKITGLPAVWRKEFNLRYLNAVYADLDVGRPESAIKAQRMPWLDAFTLAESMMEQGKLPQASILARSGRGVYLLWLLRDRDDVNAPQRAFSEKLQLYKGINRSLALKLRRLAADQGAVDAARVLKVPGTTDTRSGNKVAYWIRLNDHGQPFLHTLEGLAEQLKIEGHARGELAAGGYALPFYDLRRVKAKGKYPRRVEGFRARNAARVQDLLKIESLYNGFPRGKRRRSLTLFVEFMRFSGMDEKAVRSMAADMAARCRPPYPSDATDTPMESIIKNAWHGQSRLARSGNAALCRYFDIDRETAIDGELESILPADLKAEEKAQVKQERAAAKAEELEAVRCLWQGSGFGFGYRQLAEALTASGFPMSKDKVMRLLNKIRADKIKGKK